METREICKTLDSGTEPAEYQTPIGAYRYPEVLGVPGRDLRCNKTK